MVGFRFLPLFCLYNRELLYKLDMLENSYTFLSSFCSFIGKIADFEYKRTKEKDTKNNLNEKAKFRYI